MALLGAPIVGDTDHVSDHEQIATKLNGLVNDVIADYDATGDGVTDDATAIQNAIDAAETAGGGTVYLPEATYLIGTALTVPDNVNIEGAGRQATYIVSTNINVFVLTGADWSSIRRMSLYSVSGTNTSGAGFYLHGGTASNLVVEEVEVKGLEYALQVTATGILTHATFRNCYFSYNGNVHWTFEDGATINSVLVESCRFEETASTFGLVKAVGSAQATGSIKWVNCVFEGAEGQYAVDCGANVIWTFLGCHFEANSDGTANGADIYIGGGQGVVQVIGCNFSPPSATATTFYNIIRADSNIPLITKGNRVVGDTNGYQGFCSASISAAPNIFQQNSYSGGSATLDYLAGVAEPIRIGEYTALSLSRSFDPIVVTATTTDASATAIYTKSYANTGSGTYRSHYLVADVTCVDAAGTEYGAYTVRFLATGTTTTLTSRGHDSETGIESTAGMGAAFAVSNDNEGTIKLNVTGKAATTLEWVAAIRRVSVYK